MPGRFPHHVWFGLVALTLLAIIVSFIGSLPLSVSDIWHNADMRALWLSIRVPRIVLAVLVGAGLAVCGAAMQSLFKNPMAEPNLLGVSTGAAFFAGLAIIFSLQHSWFGLPFFAFMGAALTVLAVFCLSYRQGQTHITALLLAGIAINALAGAAIGLLLYASDDQALRSITFWMMGSISLLPWPVLGLLAVIISLAGIRLYHHAPALDLLAVGDVQARTAGVKVERIKIELVIIIALICGTITAFCGIIGFVGIIIPHIVRMSMGARHRELLCFSALLGAGFLLLADTLARTMLSPAEIPIGIITGLIGGPFFIWLLHMYVKRGAL